MRRYSQDQIKLLIEARKCGKSIPELMEMFDMPKTTIWHHVHTVKLDPVLKKQIASRQGGSALRKQSQITKAELEAKRILADHTLRDIALVGSSMYWAEGSKSALVFTNTDSDMIKIFLTFIDVCLGIKRSDCQFLIRISKPISTIDAIKFWSDIVRVDQASIKINRDDIQNRTKTKYGVCRITIRKGGFNLKVVQSMIQSLKSLS
jgi:biotin operon repressor